MSQLTHTDIQEEDFVTHTYNRTLLESLDYTLLLELLEETSESLSTARSIPSSIVEALLCRLRLRSTFLKAVEMANSRASADVKKLWGELLSFVPQLKKSAELGKAVPEAFSVKLQRKMASTVPPRPMVNVNQEAALEHFERLCRDASIVVEVLEYHDSHSLMVCWKSHQSLATAKTSRPSYLCFKHGIHNPWYTFERYYNTTCSAI